MPERKRLPRPDGLDKPVVKRLIKHGSALNVRLYRATGGRLGGRWRIMAGFRKPANILLLTVVGRVSGKRRTVPLLYLADGDDLVVVASTGGLPSNPDWLRNVQANPEVEVTIGRDVRSMRARVVDADEKARLWPRMLEVYADFDTYQHWTERDIPVVRLEVR